MSTISRTVSDKLYIYPCNYNYRADHCMYSSVCKEAEKEGIIVLHGSRGIFHSGKYPPFESVYAAMEEVINRSIRFERRNSAIKNPFLFQYSWGSDPYKDLYLKLERRLNASNQTNCGKLRDSFLRNIKNYVNMTNAR